jgi:hypothetical protein
VTIPVNGTGTASWTATQVSFRDTFAAGLMRGAGAVTFAGWTTNPVNCVDSATMVECFGGSINVGSTATVTIPMVVTGCGPLTDDATADPNNNIPEFNETNNTGTSTTTSTCDTVLSKSASGGGAVSTSAGPGTVTYTITLTDALGTIVAPSTVTDMLPGGFTGVGTPTISAGDTGTCTAFAAPPAPQVLSCTNVGGPEPVTITYVASVPTTTAAGDYPNTATATTPGDTIPANNSDTETVSVYPFDVVVSIADSASSVTSGVGVQYTYTVTVTNNSAGGFSTGAFFVAGGLQLRSSNGLLEGPVNAVTTFADIAAVSAPCTFPAPGLGGGSTQRYSCPVGPLAAGTSVAFTVTVDANALEPDGFPEVGLDGTVSTSSPPACIGGGTDAACAPESVFTNDPPAATLLNNRQVEFTDID